jgi:hypothetical protein
MIVPTSSRVKMVVFPITVESIILMDTEGAKDMKINRIVSSIAACLGKSCVIITTLTNKT